jgi:V-type H+-transporting ATPase 16kDa proteolipid subunit
MAGIIGIYGLVVSVLISDNLSQQLSLFTSFIQLGAGLSVGLAGLAAGFAIGIVGDAGVRGTAQQPRLFVGMVRYKFLENLHRPCRLTDLDSHSHFR